MTGEDALSWPMFAGVCVLQIGLGVPVTVTSEDGLSSTCYHNKFGLGPRDAHGAPYPATTYEHTGLARAGDRCITVMTLTSLATFNGWTGALNSRDCPGSNRDWPNANYGTECFLAVWIK
jgi:hypothetical protein